MSQRIQALEEQLGARLFERKRRGAILTAAGNELLPNAEALIDLHDRLVGRAHSKRVAGSVRLGVAECQAVPLLPKLLKHTCATYEAVELAVLCQQSGLLQEAMRNGTLDLAIVALLDEVPSALQLASPRLHWVAAPEFDLDSRSPIPVACAPGRDFFHKKGMTASQKPRNRVPGSPVQRERRSHSGRRPGRNGDYHHAGGHHPTRTRSHFPSFPAAAAGNVLCPATRTTGTTIRSDGGNQTRDSARISRFVNSPDRRRSTPPGPSCRIRD